jgi:pimeloyl-ACP methyl ester carboxylesterase
MFIEKSDQSLAFFEPAPGQRQRWLQPRTARWLRAVVSRGGRPDVAGTALPKVTAPTLLIVGGRDEPVIELNEEAKSKMQAAHVELKIVPGATHLFEEPGTLEEVERLAGDWFERYLKQAQGDAMRAIFLVRRGHQ